MLATTTGLSFYGVVLMSSAAEYRQKATNCQEMAEQCKDDWAKEMWLETVKIWGRLYFKRTKLSHANQRPKGYIRRSRSLNRVLRLDGDG